MFSIPSHAQEELIDVRPPVDVSEFPWFWVVAGVVIVFGLVRFLIFSKNKLASVRGKDPWDTANERLDVLRKKDLSSKGEFKEFYTELSAIVRAYIEHRFHIRAPEMTTQEFLESMKDSAALLAPQKQILKELLETADMVKFARHKPDSERAALSFDLVQRFVKETKLEKENHPGKSAAGSQTTRVN